jgi:hypothetical protein
MCLALKKKSIKLLYKCYLIFVNGDIDKLGLTKVDYEACVVVKAVELEE